MKFSTDMKGSATLWHKDHGANKMVPNYGSGAAFLDSVNLGWLVRMVEHSYGHLLGAYRAMDGSPAPASEIVALLSECNETRKKVAHHAFVDGDRYLAMLKGTRRLLQLLGIPLPEELAKTEPLRAGFVKRFIEQMDQPHLNWTPPKPTPPRRPRR